ncbi:MAG TPA: hypothetical protein VEA99_15155 [Gemmatimonadaceae bacterium]|nr:hypothetical protein [Gemmatimonadaceae bacterium]
MFSPHRRRARGRIAAHDVFESYVSLTTRASAAGWRVRVGIAQLLPIWAPGTSAHERLGLTFRATLLYDGVAVAESRGRDVTVDALPSVVWRDDAACRAFVAECRAWWQDDAEPDATIAGNVVRELVLERALEIGEVYADAPAR